MTGQGHTATDILLRWASFCLFMCVPVIAAMYLRTSWAVSVGVLCGYLLRSAWLIFGEPFRVSA